MDKAIIEQLATNEIEKLRDAVLEFADVWPLDYSTDWIWECSKEFNAIVDLVNKYIEDREAEASNPLYKVAGTVAGGLDES